eukprot:TRINITY_DN3876_c0_g1_i1.p1 TRINITY_DN3876_c0_g1~~TRINITY_DN3876_c0_g1_i1.p1  ORF type:complete len:294 (+),score=81.23 TRINITY_DN3876_c0_g1_i1:68-883(+)
MAPHGATGLLQELLAEQAAKTSQPAAADPEGAEEEAEEEEAAEVAKEIRALHDEMDDCLASLDQWRAERKQESEAMLRDMEALCNAQSNELEVAEEETKNDDALSSGAEDAEPVEKPVAVRKCVAAGAERPAQMSFAVQSLEVPEQEQARLAALRAEVEALRSREAEMERRLHGDAGIAAEALDSSLPDGLGLSEWCSEVDAVLALDPLSTDGFGALENELKTVAEHVGATKGSLESAGCRIEAELGELERMLAECDAQMARARAAQACDT